MSDHFPISMFYNVQGFSNQKGHHTSKRLRCQKYFHPDTFIKELEVLP